MILPIYAYGSPVLRKKGQIIPADYEGLQQLIADMFETMYAADGVGLAAQQIGKDILLFIIDATIYEEKHPETKDFKKIFINAEIIEEQGEEWMFEEGCLSFPGIREDINRKSDIKIKYQDENFNTHIETYTGILARIIQHEYDHTQGVFFVDRLSSLKKIMIKNKLNNIIKGNVNTSYKMKFPHIRKPVRK